MKKENEEVVELEKPKTQPKKRTRTTSNHHSLEYLRSAKSHAYNNEIEIVESKECGCFFCRHVFSARDVQDWVDDDGMVSAICPECGIDAVIGDASGFPIDKAFMKELNIAFYGESDTIAHPFAAETYVNRYSEGKITHKPKSEKLYIDYLLFLEKNSPKAETSLALGDLYRYGSQFTSPDFALALEHYRNDTLKANADALNSIGDILIRQMESPETLKEAYECFAKASSLGSLEAAYHLADCYQKGYYVKPDRRFAYEILLQNSGEVYHRFAISHQDWEDFPEFAVRLAEAYSTNPPSPEIKNDELALKYFLMGRMASMQRKILTGEDKHPETDVRLDNGLRRLAVIHHLGQNPVAYDIDTFEDSYIDFSINPGLKKLENPAFDQESHEFDFELIFEMPTLFFDIGNLNCGFLVGKTSWHFQDVAQVRLSSEHAFTKIIGDYEEGFKFAYEGQDGQDVIVAEVSFFTDKGSIKVKDGE